METSLFANIESIAASAKIIAVCVIALTLVGLYLMFKKM